jgi:chemotaxis protein MotA
MRTDPGTLLGFAIAAVGIATAVLINGGSLLALINLPALLIIGTGTLGAAMVSTSFADVLHLPHLLRMALSGRPASDVHALIQTLVRASRRAREHGPLSLDVIVADPATDPFLAQGLGLVVDHSSHATVREVLQAEIASTQQQHLRGIELLECMGGYAPTMGIIGTVLGLVHVMANLGTEGTDVLAAGVAVAFIATLYGICSANLLFLPLACNLRAQSVAEMLWHQIILEAVLGIHAGLNPRLLELRLKAYCRSSRPSPVLGSQALPAPRLLRALWASSRPGA